MVVEEEEVEVVQDLEAGESEEEVEEVAVVTQDSHVIWVVLVAKVQVQVGEVEVEEWEAEGVVVVWEELEGIASAD